MTELKFGPIPSSAMHVCIDMQRIFLEPGPWFGPTCLGIIPSIAKLARHAPSRNIFTRFITAKNAGEAKGCWQRYYRQWEAVTQDVAGSDFLNLHPDLAPLALPGQEIDKLTHDAFDSVDFTAYLERKKPDTLILSGVETDVCVLATAMSAVDLGYRTIIALDAISGSDLASHQATIDHIYPRFDQQIELVNVDNIIEGWAVA